MKNFSKFIKILPTIVIVFFGFFFANISHASAATLYFNAGADHNWDTRIGNWWTDAGFSSQAPSLPTTGDDVIISKEISSNSGPAASVNTMTVVCTTFCSTDIPVTVAHGAIFTGNGGAFDTFNAGTIHGNAIFNNYSVNAGTVTGTATFNGISYNQGTVTGNAIYNYAHAGVATIADGNYWGPGTSNSNIGDDAVPITSWVFNGSSQNQGTVSDAIFNNSSISNGGNITGVATFNDFSSNNSGGGAGGTVSGDITFHDNSLNIGIILGSATFYDHSFNHNAGILSGAATFNDSSQNYGAVSSDATFNSFSSNQGTVSGNATFNGNFSENEGGTVSGTKTRYYSSDVRTFRDFVTDGPWTVTAYGAVVNLFHATYDGTTTLTTLNGGSFTYINPSPVTFIVNSLLDDGDGTCTLTKCTFRDAVANAIDGDTINFSVTGTIVLTTSNDIEVDHNITITGPGKDKLTIDFNNDFNNYIYLQNSGEFDISGLTFTNAANAVFDYGGADSSVYNISDSDFTNNANNETVYAEYGNWNLTNDTFSNNSTSDYSGAVYFGSNGNLNITDSNFDNNISTDAGGVIYFEASSNLTISNSTFTNNSTTGDGGAIDFYGGVSSDLNISNSTFAHNTSGSYGGAFYAETGNTVTLINDTIYDNPDDGGYGSFLSQVDGLTTIKNSTFYNDSETDDNGVWIQNDALAVNNIFSSLNDDNCYESITSSGHNIESGTSCGFTAEGDMSSADSKLDPNGLNDNAGPVQTIALLKGSPAIDAADDTQAPDTDARGITRPQGLHSDIGAYEYVPPVVTKHHGTTGGSSGGLGTTPPPAFKPPVQTPSSSDCLPTYQFSPSTGKPCGSSSFTPTYPTSPEPLVPIVPQTCKIVSVLKQGMKGDEVKCLQNTMSIIADGIFGSKTKAAVMLFQKTHPPLDVDGVVGPKTRGAMGL